jgi:hypothetical protein
MKAPIPVIVPITSSTVDMIDILDTFYLPAIIIYLC